jgi:transcription antitermination factor NusG
MRVMRWERSVPWLCVHTQPKSEVLVSHSLLDLALEVFLPTRRITTRDKKTGKSVPSTIPHFPRYLFADVDHTDYFRIPKTKGVHSVVSTKDEDGYPFFLTIPPDAIQILRTNQIPALAVHDQVKLRHPYNGLRAIISSIAHLDSTGQVKVWLDILGGRREITVSVDQIQSTQGSQLSVS